MPCVWCQFSDQQCYACNKNSAMLCVQYQFHGVMGKIAVPWCFVCAASSAMLLGCVLIVQICYVCDSGCEQYYLFACDNKSARLCVIVFWRCYRRQRCLGCVIANKLCDVCDRSSALPVPRTWYQISDSMCMVPDQRYIVCLKQFTDAMFVLSVQCCFAYDTRSVIPCMY